PSLSPEELARIIREVSDRLTTAEVERHQLLADRAAATEEANELRVHLEDLTRRMTAQQPDRNFLQRALAAAEQQRAEAERTAEMFRDRAAQAMTAVAQVREELTVTRAREAARAERARARRAVPDAGGYGGLRPDPL